MTIKRTKGDKKTLQNEMKGISVVYQDKYAVEETFQLLKIPWEWYDSSEEYDVVIGRGEDLKSEDVNFNLIDLSEDDIFKKISNLLNQGVMHNREPLCEFYLDELRRKLKQFTTLVGIPPIPGGYSYIKLQLYKKIAELGVEIACAE